MRVFFLKTSKSVQTESSSMTTPGVGTVFRGWTNTERRQVSEFPKGENRRQLTCRTDGKNLESKNY
jgi:hypothetical protein